MRMNDKHLQRRFAALLRRMPVLVYLAARLYRFIQPKYSIGVVGVIFNHEGHVLLAEHVFHPETPWGLPGGWIERNENPPTALVRELQEELQLHVELGPVVLAEITYGGHLDMAYLCFPKGAIGQVSGELLGYRWFDPHHLPPIKHFPVRVIRRAIDMRVDV